MREEGKRNVKNGNQMLCGTSIIEKAPAKYGLLGLEYWITRDYYLRAHLLTKRQLNARHREVHRP